MSRLELSEQAKKILEREREALRHEAAQISARVTGPGSALSAVCKILNLRGRYFAVTGEHFSVQDYDGLQVIDALDEVLLREVHMLLRKASEHDRSKLSDQVTALLDEKLLPTIRELPKYPVAYRLLFTVRQVFEMFDSFVESNHGFQLHELESAFSRGLLGIVDRYVQTREKQTMRHFSDVAREYDVVSRMKCKCGEDRFHVKLQSLMQTDDGTPYDRLDLECKACGHQRSVTFDLPYFKDLYQV